MGKKKGRKRHGGIITKSHRRQCKIGTQGSISKDRHKQAALCRTSEEQLDESTSKFWDLDNIILGNTSNKSKGKLYMKLKRKQEKASIRKRCQHSSVENQSPNSDWTVVSRRAKRQRLKNKNIIDDKIDCVNHSTRIDQSELNCSPIATEYETDDLKHGNELNKEKLNIFLEQYFAALDFQRNVVVNAYTQNGRIEVMSNIPMIGNAVYCGIEKIAEFLSNLPETRHIQENCNLAVGEVTTNEGIAEITGQFYLNGYEDIFKFKRRMIIVPHNNGLCCNSDILEIIN